MRDFLIVGGVALAVYLVMGRGRSATGGALVSCGQYGMMGREQCAMLKAQDSGFDAPSYLPAALAPSPAQGSGLIYL